MLLNTIYLLTFLCGSDIISHSARKSGTGYD